MLYTMRCDSPIGSLLLAERNNALVGLWMEGQKYFLGPFRNEMRLDGDSPALLQGKEWLERYFAGERPPIGELPLVPEGSDFRKEVWRILCEIPYGEVTTYGEIARRLAARQGLEYVSARAVGGAVGHNPISIIIPCHRVVGANGSLTGYAGGLQRKIALLTHEGADMANLFVPVRERKG